MVSGQYILPKSAWDTLRLFWQLPEAFQKMAPEMILINQVLHIKFTDESDTESLHKVLQKGLYASAKNKMVLTVSLNADLMDILDLQEASEMKAIPQDPTNDWDDCETEDIIEGSFENSNLIVEEKQPCLTQILPEDEKAPNAEAWKFFLETQIQKSPQLRGKYSLNNQGPYSFKDCLFLVMFHLNIEDLKNCLLSSHLFKLAADFYLGSKYAKKRFGLFGKASPQYQHIVIDDNVDHLILFGYSEKISNFPISFCENTGDALLTKAAHLVCCFSADKSRLEFYLVQDEYYVFLLEVAQNNPETNNLYHSIQAYLPKQHLPLFSHLKLPIGILQRIGETALTQETKEEEKIYTNVKSLKKRLIEKNYPYNEIIKLNLFQLLGLYELQLRLEIVQDPAYTYRLAKEAKSLSLSELTAYFSLSDFQREGMKVLGLSLDAVKHRNFSKKTLEMIQSSDLSYHFLIKFSLDTLNSNENVMESLSYLALSEAMSLLDQLETKHNRRDFFRNFFENDFFNEFLKISNGIQENDLFQMLHPWVQVIERIQTNFFDVVKEQNLSGSYPSLSQYENACQAFSEKILALNEATPTQTGFKLRSGFTMSST